MTYTADVSMFPYFKNSTRDQIYSEGYEEGCEEKAQELAEFKNKLKECMTKHKQEIEEIEEEKEELEIQNTCLLSDSYNEISMAQYEDMQEDYEEEIQKLKRENEGLREKLDEGTEQHLADTKKLNKFYMKTKKENEELKEEAEQNKQLFDITFGECMKLKEKIEELKEIIMKQTQCSTAQLNEIEKLKEEQEYTLDDLHELVKDEGFDTDLYDEENFDVEDFIHDVKEKIDELDNDVDRLSELESIAWIDFYGEKEVIDNIKIYKFREDIQKMKDINEVQHAQIYFTKSSECLDMDEFVEWLKDEYTEEKCEKFKKLLDYEEDE